MRGDGPWRRPGWADYSFARPSMAGQPVTLYEGEALARDFTCNDDVTRAVLAVYAHPPAPNRPRILNVGNDRPESVRHLVSLLEQHLGRTAQIALQPRPGADVERTWANISAIHALTGWKPSTTLEKGIGHFVSWLRESGLER